MGTVNFLQSTEGMGSQLPNCLLCNIGDERLNRFFLNYPYVKEVWSHFRLAKMTFLGQY